MKRRKKRILVSRKQNLASKFGRFSAGTKNLVTNPAAREEDADWQKLYQSSQATSWRLVIVIQPFNTFHWSFGHGSYDESKARQNSRNILYGPSMLSKEASGPRHEAYAGAHTPQMPLPSSPWHPHWFSSNQHALRTLVWTANMDPAWHRLSYFVLRFIYRIENLSLVHDNSIRRRFTRVSTPSFQRKIFENKPCAYRTGKALPTMAYLVENPKPVFRQFRGGCSSDSCAGRQVHRREKGGSERCMGCESSPTKESLRRQVHNAWSRWQKTPPDKPTNAFSVAFSRDCCGDVRPVAQQETKQKRYCRYTPPTKCPAL
ncbi:uncharacterized protein CIMG_08116 [Coccidioides immitis RS]|uniref:Uncharacterized protein n=1 Tax=Coccidioides immitis (strain RS) TaxID=246410 RepID=J3K4U9_COCIM|nr:uncharacterized protein CIMG_08116 [Coccidioides immitis RS]EAS29370.3 hypothetical protein CIMG_08116 [Coccidioides immitis RS]